MSFSLSAPGPIDGQMLLLPCVLDYVCSPRHDLSDVPYTPGLVLYVDDLASRDPVICLQVNIWEDCCHLIPDMLLLCIVETSEAHWSNGKIVLHYDKLKSVLFTKSFCAYA